jgi:two-component system LytT family sensor kinase
MKGVWYKKKWVVVLLHAAAWILLFSLPYLLRPTPQNEQSASSKPAHSMYFSLFMNLSWIIIFYLNALFLIPTLVYKKKNWLYAFAALLIFSWQIVQTRILFYLFMNEAEYKLRTHLFFTFFIFLFILAASTAFRTIKDRMENERIIKEKERLAKEKENEQLKTELSFLRSQVSPHFMFNVLNNMVALARKKSDILEPSLIKLSSLLRYMLYETDEEKVLLEKEIDYLRSYIDLQMQRFGSKVKVNVSMEDFDKSYFIEPMLLIPFVENAFKHGTGLIQNAEISVELKAQNNLLQFVVTNQHDNNSQETKDKTSGIGLQNVRRRLNLLYKNNYGLLISDKDNKFVVSLQLNLH